MVGVTTAWISILGHNFDIDQHFCTKFGTMMENLKSATQGDLLLRIKLSKSKITDGRHLEFKKVIIIQWWIEIFA